MYVRARLKVFINGSLVKNVVNVEITNNSRNIGASCEITLPLNARIKSDRLAEQEKIPFNESDYVQVYAKYDGRESDPNAVVLPGGKSDDKYLLLFTGFINNFTYGTPFKIKCIDYVYWCNLQDAGTQSIDIYNRDRNGEIELYVKDEKTGKMRPAKKDEKGVPIVKMTGIGLAWPNKVKFLTVLQTVIDEANKVIDDYNTGGGGKNEPPVNKVPKIELYQIPGKSDYFDMELENLAFIRMTPAAILDHFRREIGFVVTFIGNKLYVNVTNFEAGRVMLKSNVNVYECGLQTNYIIDRRKRTSRGALSVFNRIKVEAVFIDKTGQKKSFFVGDPLGETRQKFFYSVAEDNRGKDKDGIPFIYKDRANDALTKLKQEVFSGEVTTPLYPYFDLFWTVRYKDVRFEDRNGEYTVISIKYNLGENGFKRTALCAFLHNEEATRL